MASTPAKKWTEAEEDTIRRLYNAGESGAAIARELGDRSPSSVNTRIRKMREAGTLALPLVEALADEAEAMEMLVEESLREIVVTQSPVVTQEGTTPYTGPIAFVQPERIRVGQIILDAMGAPVKVIAVDVAEAHPAEDPEREDSPGVDIITLSGIHCHHIDSGHIPEEATWHISLPAGTLTEVAICGYTPPGSRRSCGVNPGHKDRRIGHCYSVSPDDLGFFRDSADVVDGVAEAVPA